MYQSCTLCGPWSWLHVNHHQKLTYKHEIADLIQNEMVFGDTHFLFLVTESKTRAWRPELLSSTEVPLDSCDGGRATFSVAVHKVCQRWYCELIKVWILHRTVLGFGPTVWKEREGTRPPTLRISDLIGEAMQLATLLAEARGNGKQVSQVLCLSKDNFKGSYGRQVRLLRTRDKFHSSGLISNDVQDF